MLRFDLPFFGPFNGVFLLPDSYSETYFDTDSDSMQKCSTGTDSDGDSYGQFL